MGSLGPPGYALEGSDDFAYACVWCEFRFHFLGHPYCLRSCFAAQVKIRL